jgi:chromosome segregation ATPase
MATTVPQTTNMGVSADGTTATPSRTVANVIEQNPVTNEINNVSEKDDKCSISIKDYEDVRMEMKQDIDKYYSKILTGYTDNYNQYLSKINSSEQNDIDYATTQLKPKVIAYNKQLININKEMIKRANDVSSLIDEQKESLTTKRDKIKINYDKIDKLEKRRADLKTEVNSNKNYLADISDSSGNQNLYTSIYIGINLLLFIIIIGVLIYMLF